MLGVMFFFRPIAEADSGSGPVPAPVIGFLIYIGLCVALFDWSSRQMRSAWKGGFVVAAGQYLVVIDLMLRGERGLLTALASGALLTVTWAVTAFAYDKLIERSGP